MTDFEGLLRVLVEGGVEFIVVGGMAAVAHGSAHVTHRRARGPARGIIERVL
jgi:hypothetical protein